MAAAPRKKPSRKVQKVSRKKVAAKTARRTSKKAAPKPASPPPPALADPASVAVLMAVASSADGVRVNLSTPTPKTTPKNLMSLRFDDPRVGIKSAANIEALRGNLVRLLPQVTTGFDTLTVTPASRIGDTARLVATLIAKAAAPQRGPDVLTVGATGEARKKVEDRWGKAFASKCSAALLRRLTAPTREAFAVTQAQPAVILEFSEQIPAPLDAIRAASRTHRLASMRDAFYRVASPMCASIEKRSGASTVQVCWLNSTVRVAGQVTAVADVADHHHLQVVDVSRRMRREMDVSGLTVHAAATRTQFSVTGSGVRVAVIDGEVNVSHAAFGGRAALQENFTAEPFGSPDAHGTAVAGIIAAADAQFSGIAPDAIVLNYKVFPTGSDEGDEFQGMLAIEHALRDGVEIANCSWGIGSAGDGTTRDAKGFNKAWSEGLILIKSAGNDGPDADTMTSPADADGVIVVGATEREGTAVQDYSSRGPTPNGKHPHMVAPGGTEVANIITCDTANGFAHAGRGTSFAAPVVAGAAALLRQQFPSATPDEIRQRLVNMCQPFAAGDVNAVGAGLIDMSLFSLV
jgi:hypothetical protein